MSFFLFQASLAAYLLAAAAYLVFFLTSRNEVRRIAHGIFLAAALLHTVNILARYVEAGHTPITSHHETVSFFAWSLAACYLSFRWRYTVKNLGVFVSVPVVALMLVAAFSSRTILPLAPALQSWYLTWLLPLYAFAGLPARWHRVWLVCVLAFSLLPALQDKIAPYWAMFVVAVPAVVLWRAMTASDCSPLPESDGDRLPRGTLV